MRIVALLVLALLLPTAAGYALVASVRVSRRMAESRRTADAARASRPPGGQPAAAAGRARGDRVQPGGAGQELPRPGACAAPTWTPCATPAPGWASARRQAATGPARPTSTGPRRRCASTASTCERPPRTDAGQPGTGRHRTQPQPSATASTGRRHARPAGPPPRRERVPGPDGQPGISRPRRRRAPPGPGSGPTPGRTRASAAGPPTAPRSRPRGSWSPRPAGP